VREITAVRTRRTADINEKRAATARRAKADGRITRGVPDFVAEVRRLVSSGDLSRSENGKAEAPRMLALKTQKV
jgi:hypothetical protein